jgi:hypothetical protein
MCDDRLHSRPPGYVGHSNEVAVDSVLRPVNKAIILEER